MIEAKTQQEKRSFFQSIYGAVFFGVPSHGLEIAALETLLEDQAKWPLASNLSEEATALAEQNIQFNSIIGNQALHMEYFYETKGSPQRRKVSQ